MTSCRRDVRTSMSGFDAQRLKQLRDVMAGHVERDTVGGVAWLAARAATSRSGSPAS